MQIWYLLNLQNFEQDEIEIAIQTLLQVREFYYLCICVFVYLCVCVRACMCVCVCVCVAVTLVIPLILSIVTMHH